VNGVIQFGTIVGRSVTDEGIMTVHVMVDGSCGVCAHLPVSLVSRVVGSFL
jgi:hypothetical protein